MKQILLYDFVTLPWNIYWKCIVIIIIINATCIALYE